MLKRTGIVPVAILVIAGIASAQNPDNLRWGAGLHGGNHLSGIGINYQAASTVGLMGIVGVNHAPHLAFKPRVRFIQRDNVGVYGWGLVGLWDHDHPVDDGFGMYFGGGAGVEFDWRELDPVLPPIGWSLEAGITSYYDFVIGLGIMWYF